MTSGPYASRTLCRVDDLDDPGSEGFSVNTEGATKDILVVRLGTEVYGYLNSCPHTGAPLDWVPGRFLDPQREFIQCATHGALFCLVDGLCVYGPCAGDRLAPVSVTVMDGEVVMVGVDNEPGDAKEQRIYSRR
jgi:nitrite reductase/ring-hydroxylating ferredoxin subunit